MISRELREVLELLEQYPQFEIQKIIITYINYTSSYPTNHYQVIIFNYATRHGHIIKSVDYLKRVLENL